uniref:LEPR-XLL domain-containing protein n=1 Tax=Parastrongyloides trichosuri TaxID=131310 RepID=A0A0N4ZJL1_PARTI
MAADAGPDPGGGGRLSASDAGPFGLCAAHGGQSERAGEFSPAAAGRRRTPEGAGRGRAGVRAPVPHRLRRRLCGHSGGGGHLGERSAGGQLGGTLERADQGGLRPGGPGWHGLFHLVASGASAGGDRAQPRAAPDGRGGGPRRAHPGPDDGGGGLCPAQPQGRRSGASSGRGGVQGEPQHHRIAGLRQLQPDGQPFPHRRGQAATGRPSPAPPAGADRPDAAGVSRTGRELEPRRAVDDRLIGLGRQLLVAGLAAADIDGARDLLEVEAVGDEIDLAVFEGAGGLGRLHQAQEDRAGVGRQLLVGVDGEGGGVELALHHQAGHARLAFLTGDGDAVGDDFLNAGGVMQALLDLGGRDVLALPAVGVAQTVHEVEIAVAVLTHQVAGAEPAVALLEDVSEDLLLRGLLVGVAREVVADVAADLADGFAGLADGDGNALAVRSAQGLARLRVQRDQADVDLRLQIARHAADGARLAVKVEQGDVALGGAIELHDVLDAEALLELGPDVGAQAVAEGQPQLVGALVLVGRAVDQIATQLADIDEHGGAGRLHVGPEMGRGEAAADDHPPAVQQDRADPDQTAGRVIQRQAVVEGVLGRRGRGSGEGAHIGAGARMRDARGLGQAGGARGEDEQGRVAVGQTLAQALVGPHRRGAAHRVVDVAAVVGLVLVGQAVDPAHQVAIDEGTGLLDRAPAVLIRHHVEGVGDGQAVGQGLARQIGVDQGRGHADLGEADPGGQVFDPVVHHQGDDVGALQVPRLGPVGVAVGQGVQLAIGQATGLVLDRDIVRELVDGLLDVVTEQDVAVEGDGLDALQETVQPARELHIAPDVRCQTHGCAASSRISLSTVMDGRRRRVNRSRARIATMFRRCDAWGAFSMTLGSPCRRPNRHSRRCRRLCARLCSQRRPQVEQAGEDLDDPGASGRAAGRRGGGGHADATGHARRGGGRAVRPSGGAARRVGDHAADGASRPRDAARRRSGSGRGAGRPHGAAALSVGRAPDCADGRCSGGSGYAGGPARAHRDHAAELTEATAQTEARLAPGLFLGVDLGPGGRHAPDDIAHVVGDQKRAGANAQHPDGAAHGLALVVAEAGQDVLRRARRLAAAERHEDHLVATVRLAVPRAVLADDGPVAPLGHQGAGVEGQAQRGGVRAEGVVGRDGFGHQVRPLRLHALVHVLAVVAVGPPVEAAVLHRGEVIGHQIVADLVALVDRNPEAAARGEDAARPACRVDLQHGGAVDLFVQPILADVGVGADADVELGAIRRGDQVLGPVVVATGGQVRDLDRRGADLRLAGLIGDGDHGVGVGDEQALADQGHAERRVQPLDEGGAGVGHAVLVAVTQQGDAVGAGHSGAGLAHDAALEPAADAAAVAGLRLGRRVGLGHQHVAVGQHVQPARVVQPDREGVDRQTLRRDRGAAFGPAHGGGDLDRGDLLRPGLGQLRIGAEADAFGQGAFGAEARRSGDREGRDLRPAGAERGRQDDDDLHRLRHRHALDRDGDRRRSRHPEGLSRRPHAHRLGAAGADDRRLRDGAGHRHLQPGPVRQGAEPGLYRAHPSRPQPVGQEGRQDHDPVRRDEAPRHDRQGPEPRTGHPLPGRADGGRGRGAAPRHVGPGAPAAGSGRHHHPDHPLYRGGRGDGRPGGGHPQGRADPGREDRHPDAQARQEDPDPEPAGADDGHPGGTGRMGPEPEERGRGAGIRL